MTATKSDAKTAASGKAKPAPKDAIALLMAARREDLLAQAA